MIFRILLLIFAMTLSLSARAETVLVKAARYLDVATGAYVSPAAITIIDGHISTITPSHTPADARVIDLGDLTILPGLMDAHTHLSYDVEGDLTTVFVKESAADFALRGARNARKTLLAGFTTVRDLGSGGFADVSLMRAIDKGWVTGPRILPAGHAISITGGHCDTTGFIPGVLEGDPTTGLADGAPEVLKAVRYQIKHGAKVIKVCATAGVLSHEGPAGAQQMTLEELRAAAEEAHRHGITIAAHAHGTEGIIAAAQAGIDSIEHNSVMTDEAARIIKEHGTYVVPTLYLAKAIPLDKLPANIRAKAKAVMPLADESFKRALKHRLKIVFGTDAAVYPHGDNAREFKVRVDLGQSPIEAIRSATTYAAALFGTPDRGAIQPQMLADLIAVAGDPLHDVSVLEDVRFVMKGGHVYKQ